MIPRRYRQIKNATPAGAANSVQQADAKDALARFERVLSGMRSPTTVRLYVGIVRRWLAAGGAVDRADPQTIQQWMAHRRTQGAARATINVDIKALRAFYDIMALLGAAPQEEKNNLPSNRRIEPRPVRYFSDDQVLRMLSLPPVDTYLGYRDSVLMRVLWETGLRASELIGLRTTDITEGALYVAAGKGGKSRWVPISDELYGLLQGYIDLRGTTRPGKQLALWVTQHGRALRSRRTVWAIVSHWARAALHGAVGYEKVRRAARQRPWTGQYPHLLRASMATTLLHHGCNLTAIMQMLGHSSLDSTARYLGTDITHLRAAIAKHPRHSGRSPREPAR